MLYPGSVVPLAMFKVRFLGNDLAKSLLLDQALFEESSEIFSNLKRETVSRWSGKKCLWSQVLTKAQLIPQTKNFLRIRRKIYFQSQDFRDKVYLQLFSELTLSSLVLIFLDGSSSLLAACCSVKTSCWKMPLFCNNPSSSILPCRGHCWENYIFVFTSILHLPGLLFFPCPPPSPQVEIGWSRYHNQLDSDWRCESDDWRKTPSRPDFHPSSAQKNGDWALTSDQSSSQIRWWSSLLWLWCWAEQFGWISRISTQIGRPEQIQTQTCTPSARAVLRPWFVQWDLKLEVSIYLVTISSERLMMPIYNVLSFWCF